jgi:hypothetical protein
LDIESRKILRSGFDFTLNLTSAIGNLANRGFLASYVSRHTAMAYDTIAIAVAIAHCCRHCCWPLPLRSPSTIATAISVALPSAIAVVVALAIDPCHLRHRWPLSVAIAISHHRCHAVGHF